MSTRLQENAIRRFAGHETFAPRFGWLRKAHAAVRASVADDVIVRDGVVPHAGGSDVFLRKQAPVELGVGKNMVNAMRYWSQAFGLTVEKSAGGTSRALLAYPTIEACWLLDDDGVDPWLEDPASLWLLHWWLLRPTSLAPGWWVAFNLQPSLRFSEDDLVALIDTHISLAGWDAVMRSSIAKDVDCLTKMYASRRSAAGSPGSVEDLLDCPFRELGLLELVPGENKTWRFADTPRLPVPAAIATYAALDYMVRNDLSGQVTLARLAHEPGGVGRALRLTEPSIAESLSEISSHVDGLTVSDSVAGRSLVVNGDPATLSATVLAVHYQPENQRSPDQRVAATERRHRARGSKAS